MDKDNHLIFEAYGLSKKEYHQARKDAYEGAGEELGKGPIKVVLKHDTTIDCYKAGIVQGVRFVKGTIFNCDVNVGDYYECDTEEYGGIAVFPQDVKVLKGEENAEDSAEDKMRDRENARDEKQRDAEVSSAFHYDPMSGLMKAANQIREILQGAANDEARTEHIIKMAQTILGSPKDYNPQEYRKMLDGLIVLLNRFIVVPMN